MAKPLEIASSRPNQFGGVVTGRTSRRLDALIWVITAVVATIVLVAPVGGRFRLDLTSYAVPVAAGAVLLAAAMVYRLRREAKLVAALEGTAQLLAFAAVAAPLSYIAAALGYPLQDHLFDAADRSLGFDWMAWLRWMNTHPVLHYAFKAAYMSFLPQATITVLVLAFTARSGRLRLFLLAFMVATLVTIAISGVLPAQGVWGHYGLSAADHPSIEPATREAHLRVFNGLRDASFVTLAGLGSEGIITFPSLHSAVALIFIFALWPVPVLRWVSLAVNALMILATPVDGGHYFVDVFAGLLIAVMAWNLARAIAGDSASA